MSGPAPRVSVVALTRDRPKAFRNLLEALRLQRMRSFEVIAVGAHERAEDHGAPPELAARIAYAPCAEENVSLSRNIGLALAKAPIVAFIDDDAAPEPDWLSELEAAFEAPEVGAVGGFVRGRNGVDFQWRGAVVDRYGAHRPMTTEDLTNPDLHDPGGERFVSTVGVNGAYRRRALVQIGGFDEHYHYFLDESDVCIRLREVGWRVAVAPEAEVHHAYAASPVRRANRAPRDLYQIAASRAYFAHVHGHPDWRAAKLEAFAEEQRTRLTKFVGLGRISRRQAAEMAARLDEGLEEGVRRWRAGRRLFAPHDRAKRIAAAGPFLDGPARRPRVALVVGGLARGPAARAADRLVEAGCEVTLIDFMLRARRLRVAFEDGLWRHVGGVLGRDRLDAPVPSPRRAARAKRELSRIARRRDFDAV
ncbi:MAG: glycosyltransferase, partial [Pseudomonadota bacterium]